MTRVLYNPSDYSKFVSDGPGVSSSQLSAAEARYHDAGVAMSRGINIPLEDAIKFLCEALRDPQKPSWCARSLIGCLLAIRPCGPQLAVLRKSHSDYWTSLAGFITTTRTTEGLIKLDKQWSVCNCNTSSPLVQKLHIMTMGLILFKTPFGRDGPLGLFLEFAYEPFNELVWEKKLKAVSVAQSKKPELWPASISDIVVHGPEAVVQSIIAVTNFMDTGHAILFLATYLKICGPPLNDAVINSSLAKCLYDFAEMKCLSFTTSERRRTEPSFVDDFVGSIYGTCVFLGKKHNEAVWVPAQTEKFYTGQEVHAMKVILQIIEISESYILPEKQRNRLQNDVNFLASEAVLLRRMSPRLCNPFVHPKFFQFEISMSDSVSGPAPIVYDVLRFAKKLQTCFALECSSSLQTANTSFKRCSGCSVVAYCSKDCQAKAWTDVRCSHKKICKKTRQVIDLAGDCLDGKESLFVKRVKANVEEQTLKELYAWYATLNSRKGSADGTPTPSLSLLYDMEGNRTREVA